MVFEEFPKKPLELKQEQLAGWQFGKFGTEGRKIALPISGKTKAALRNTVQKWIQFKNAADAQVAAGWQATRRMHHRERAVFLVDSADDFRTKAAAFMSGEQDPEVIVESVHPAFSSPKICFVFSGYGQQWDDMGRRLYATEPIFKAVVDECDTIFQKVAGYSALEKHQIFVEGKSSITGEACKPAILFMQTGLYKLLEHWGVKPDMVMGTGLGEMTAALASGALTLEDVMKCMHVRMSAPPMKTFLQKIQQVINGPRPKNTDFYSTITGEKYTGVLDAEYWWKNVVTQGTQKIADTVKSILTEDENTTFIEISASDVLLPMIRTTIQEAKSPSKTISCGQKMVDDQSMLMKAVASLHCVGYRVNWANISRNAIGFVPVPLYGWDHQFIRLESIEYAGRRNGLDDRSFKGQFGNLNFEKHAYLRDYLINDEYVFPTAGFVEFFAEYDDSDLSCLRDISIKTNIKVEPLHPDGFVNDVKIDMQRKRSSLKAYDVNNELLAEATIVKAHAPEKRPVISVASIRSRCQKSLDVAQQYDSFQNMGLSYGRAYKLLDDLLVGDGEAVGTIRGSKLGHERVNTPFLDAAFQVALASFTHGTTLYLPTDIHQLHMYVPKVDKHVSGYAHAVLKEWSITHFVADITIADKEGNVMIHVTGMKAKNVVPETSEVDQKTCLYTTKWQTQAAVLPNTQICESAWSKDLLESKYPKDMKTLAWAEKNMEKLKTLAASHCRDVLKGVSEDTKPSNQALYSLFKTHAKSAPETEIETSALAEEIGNSGPELAAEIYALKVLAEQAPEMISNAEARDGYLKSAAAGKLLNDAVSSRIYHNQCAEMLKEAVSTAVMKKDVIRICQIGCISAAFTYSMTAVLQEYIVADRVEYVCTDVEDSVLNDIQRALGDDVPKVSYEVFDPTKALPEQDMVARSFDMVLTFDPHGHLQSHMDILCDLVLEGGWLVLVEAVHNTDLLNLMLAGGRIQEKPLSEIQWCKALRKMGFAELRTLATPDEMFYSTIIGRKLRSPKVDKLEASSKWILINSKSDLAKAFTAKLPVGSKVCGSVEFLATHDTLLSEESKAMRIVFMYDDKINTTNEVLELVDVLRNHQKKEAINLWFISQRTIEGHTTVSAAVSIGYLRAAANEENLYIYTVELACGKAEGIANDLAHAIKYHNTGDRELVLAEDGMFVPRITRLDVASQPTCTGQWVAKIGESGVHCQASTRKKLKGTDIRISVRGMAMQSFSADSFKAYAGIVEEAGVEVTKFNAGDAVVVAGVYQIGSRVVAPENIIIKKPVKLTWSQAAETLLNYIIAYHALIEEGGVEEKETVLVYPPSTGLGQAAMQIAKERGARVICAMQQNGQASNVVSKLGMMVMADPSSSTFASDLMDVTDNNGVDVIFQSTKEDLPASCLSALAYGARICKTGNHSFTLSETSNAIVLPPLSTTLKTTSGRIQDIVTVVAAKLDAGKYNSFATETTSVSDLSNKVRESTGATLDNTYGFLVPENYVPSELQQSELTLKSGASYVVTGAYGRTGQEVARWLADMGAKHVAMVDRSGCRNCFHKTTRRYIQSRGCTAYDIRADVSKLSEVEKIFKTLHSEGAPEIKGIFHMAAYTDDISGRSEETLEKMKSVQVTGAQNLHEVSTNLNQDLDQFVLFSSSSTAWGNRSQEALCAVSNGLDVLAHQRKAQNMAALSVQLGLVRGCGTIFDNAALTGEMEVAGMASLHMHEYLNIVSGILQNTHVPAVVAITDQVKNGCPVSHISQIRRKLSGKAELLFLLANACRYFTSPNLHSSSLRK